MDDQLTLLGFQLYPVKTQDGSNLMWLGTPFLLDNEFPFDIFVEWKDGELHLFDEGTTWHGIGAMGFRLNDENFKRYRDFMQENGVTVGDDVVLNLNGSQMEAQDLMSRYLTACILLDKSVRKIFGQKGETNFDRDLAAEEEVRDEAYGAARDARFNEKVLEDYKRTQNERLVNAFAGRLLKTYSPGRHNEDQEADSETDVPFGRKAK